MRARPVLFAQKPMNSVARMSAATCGGWIPDVASLTRATDEGFVQHGARNKIAIATLPGSRTPAPGIAARKSVMSQAPANHAIDHTATRAKSFALRGSAATGGSDCGNEITSTNSTQLKITSG